MAQTNETTTAPFELITGCDGGNTKTKLSYLNETKEVIDLLIPTVIAPAPSSSLQMSGGPVVNMNATQSLHVEIESLALPQNASRSFYYVGESAYTRKDMRQPKGETKHDSSLHLIVTLTSLAIAAAEVGQEDVRVHYAGGLPIDEFKEQGQNLLKQLRGQHKVTFVDGKHSGVSINIDIYDGVIMTEGVSSLMGLMFSVEKGEIVDTALEASISESNAYVVADLGAETLDLAYYQGGVLDKHTSQSLDLGTNRYIDSMIRRVSELPDFDAARKSEDSRIAVAREDFVNRFIIPSMDTIFDSKKTPKFTAQWAMVRNVDITDIVLETMNQYAHDVAGALVDYWASSALQAESIYLVGGGALFGYQYLSEADGFVFLPSDQLSDSAFVTARSYLINNFLQLSSDAVKA